MATHGTPTPRVLAFKLKEPAAIFWHGVGGRTVAKTIRHDLHVVQSVRPPTPCQKMAAGSFNLNAKSKSLGLRSMKSCKRRMIE